MKITFKPIKPLGRGKPRAMIDVIAHTNDVYNNKNYKMGYRTPMRLTSYHGYVRDKTHLIKDTDVMTKTHETCHGVNNDIANNVGKGRSANVGLYGLNDVGFVIPEPQLTISQVAAKVPMEYRGGTCKPYDLYCVSQASSWNDRPLYLADEWFAYASGAQAALEMAESGDGDANRWSEIQNCILFNGFLGVLFSLLPLGNKEVFEMMAWQYDRVDKLYKESQKHPTLVRGETTEILQTFYSSKYYKPFKDGGGEKLKDYGSGEYL